MEIARKTRYCYGMKRVLKLNRKDPFWVEEDERNYSQLSLVFQFKRNTGNVYNLKKSKQKVSMSEMSLLLFL